MSISSVGIPYYMTCKDHDERVQSSVDLCKWNFEMVFRTCPRATKIASAVDFFFISLCSLAHQKRLQNVTSLHHLPPRMIGC